MSTVSKKEVSLNPQKKITSASESLGTVSMEGEFLTTSTETGDEIIFVESEE